MTVRWTPTTPTKHRQPIWDAHIAKYHGEELTIHNNTELEMQSKLLLES